MGDPTSTDAGGASPPLEPAPDGAWGEGAARLAAASPPAPMGGDTPFLLAGAAAWLVVRGTVDVFAVPLAADGHGARTHLARLGRGGLLLPVAEPHDDLVAAHALLAVPTAGAMLSTFPLDAVWALPARALLDLLDRWVETLCTGVAADHLAPSRAADLEVGREVRLERQTSARPRGVAWVRHIDGHSFLLGHDGLSVNGAGYTPIARQAWLQAREPVRVEVLAIDAVVAAAGTTPDVLRDGIGRLHALVLRALGYQAAQRTLSQRARLVAKASAGADMLAGATRGLADALNPNGARPLRLRQRDVDTPDLSWDAALFAAARLVAGASGITLRPYPTGEGRPTPRDPIGTLARVSAVRVRQVALRDEWWRGAHGALLARIEDNAHPVALLPVEGPFGTGTGYQLHDPFTAGPVTVDAALAARLAPFAHSFSRPFPDRALSLGDVLRFGLSGSRRDVSRAVVLAAATALLGLAPALIAARLFNDVIPGADRGQLLQLTFLLFACGLGMALFQVTRTMALLRVEERMGESIQSAVWDRLLALPMPFFRSYAAGDLALRAMSVDAVRQVISGVTITAVLTGVFSLVNFALMFRYSPPLAWRATLIIGAAVAVTAAGSLAQLKYGRATAALQSRTSGLVLQLLSSVAKLRVAGAEHHAFALWARRFAEQRRLQLRARDIGGWVQTFNAALPAGAFALLFAAAAPMLESGTMLRTGDFLAFLAAYATCQGALLGACAALLSTLSAVPLYEQARPILVTRPEVGGGQADPGVLSGEIDIQHAVFRYASDGPQILRDVSLRVEAGEFVAFVGPSGSGKSTLLRLLLGFETLESGGIYYDGQELGALDVRAVRQQIGVVLQNGRVTSGDLFTNIAGSASVSLEDAWEAARMAGLADEIRAMPMGMHTVVADGGGTLSGGQRQRLLIARAIVQRPRLLFFDEATSALDNRTQAIVSASLERLNATRVVVAHRLSTIERADRIFVIERGRLVETGSYAELMTRGGLFSELARRQLT